MSWTWNNLSKNGYFQQTTIIQSWLWAQERKYHPSVIWYFFPQSAKFWWHPTAPKLLPNPNIKMYDIVITAYNSKLGINHISVSFTPTTNIQILSLKSEIKGEWNNDLLGGGGSIALNKMTFKLQNWYIFCNKTVFISLFYEQVLYEHNE